MDQSRLVQLTLRGDVNAFAGIVERYQVAVYNLAYRLLGNASEAEDAAQESFVRAFTRLSTYDPEQSFITWLLSITAHHCIDVSRGSKRVRVEPVDELELVSIEGDPEDQAVTHERNLEIRRALDLLPDHYRLIVVLRYWYDLSYREIGQVAGLGEGVVKIRLHRAREMLARFIPGPSGPAEGKPQKGIAAKEGTESNALFRRRRADVASP